MSHLHEQSLIRQFDFQQKSINNIHPTVEKGKLRVGKQCLGKYSAHHNYDAAVGCEKPNFLASGETFPSSLQRQKGAMHVACGVRSFNQSEHDDRVAWRCGGGGGNGAFRQYVHGISDKMNNWGLEKVSYKAIVI